MSARLAGGRPAGVWLAGAQLAGVRLGGVQLAGLHLAGPRVAEAGRLEMSGSQSCSRSRSPWRSADGSASSSTGLRRTDLPISSLRGAWMYRQWDARPWMADDMSSSAGIFLFCLQHFLGVRWPCGTSSIGDDPYRRAWQIVDALAWYMVAVDGYSEFVGCRYAFRLRAVCKRMAIWIPVHTRCCFCGCVTSIDAMLFLWLPYTRRPHCKCHGVNHRHTRCDSCEFGGQSTVGRVGLTDGLRGREREREMLIAHVVAGRSLEWQFTQQRG